jgi:hypothetical protein
MGGKKGWVGILCVALAATAGCSKKVEPPQQATSAAAAPAIDPVTDYDQVEDAQSAAGSYLKKAVSAHLLKRDVASLLGSFTPDFRSTFPEPAMGRKLDEDGVVITDFAGAHAPETDAPGFQKRLQLLVDRYAVITRSQFRCFTFLLDKGGQRARGFYHWWLSGKGPKGERLEVQGDFVVDYAGPVGSWKISRIGFPSGALVESTRAPFADITDPTDSSRVPAEGRAAPRPSSTTAP